MIGNLKKYIDKVSFMEHIDAKLRQNEPMIIDLNSATLLQI